MEARMITTYIPITTDLLRRILHLPGHVEFLDGVRSLHGAGNPVQVINLRVRVSLPNPGVHMEGTIEPIPVGIAPLHEMGETWGPRAFVGWSILDSLAVYDKIRERDDEALQKCTGCGVMYDKPHPMSAFRDSPLCCNCGRTLRILQEAEAMPYSLPEGIKAQVLRILEARRRMKDADTQSRRVKFRQDMYKAMDELETML
jgi:hypothetical protein